MNLLVFISSNKIKSHNSMESLNCNHNHVILNHDYCHFKLNLKFRNGHTMVLTYKLSYSRSLDFTLSSDDDLLKK